MSDEENINVRTVGNTRIPAILSLRDVFLMMTAVVSVMVAWGMYGTRLSVVEEKMLSVKNGVAEIREIIKDVRTETKRDRHDVHAGVVSDLERIEGRLRQVETNYGRLEGLIKHHNDK